MRALRRNTCQSMTKLHQRTVVVEGFVDNAGLFKPSFNCLYGAVAPVHKEREMLRCISPCDVSTYHYERNVGLNYMIRLRFSVCWYQWGGSCATRDFHIARKNLDTP